MDKVDFLLASIRSSLRSNREKQYFLIHSVRYRFLLNKILALKLPTQSTILDIGCYPPHLFRALKTLDFKVHGVSSPNEPVAGKNIKILNAEHERLPYPDNYFDAVLFFEVLEHFLIDPKIYLKEIGRILKPNGKLLISTPNSVNIKKRLLILLGRSVYFPLPQLYETSKNHQDLYYRHNREYTSKEVEDLLRRSGFKIEASQYFNAYTPFRKKTRPESTSKKIAKFFGFFLTNFYPPLKDSLYFVASHS